MRAYVGSPITARIEEDVRSDVGSRQTCHSSPYLGPTLRPWWRAGRCGLWVEALPGELADRRPPLHRARVAMALAKLGTTDAWTEMQPPRPAHHAGQQRRLRPRQLGPRRDLARRPPPPRPADPPVPDQTAAYRLPATTTPRQRPRPARPCARRHHRPSPVTLARSAASACVWEASTGGDICLHRRPVRRRPRQPRLPDRRRRQPRPRPTRLQVAHQQISRLAKASALGRARLRHTARVVRPASSLGGRPESKRAEHRRRADRAVEPRRRPLTKLFALLVRGCRRRREPSRFISPHNGRLVTRILLLPAGLCTAVELLCCGSCYLEGLSAYDSARGGVAVPSNWPQRLWRGALCGVSG
jgi:hypothetical protein